MENNHGVKNMEIFKFLNIWNYEERTLLVLGENNMHTIIFGIRNIYIHTYVHTHTHTHTYIFHMEYQ
jgi:hypothetical protein